MNFLSAPYDSGLFRKHALFYVALQVIIWIKVFFFYSLYGHGYFVASPFALIFSPQFLAIPHLTFDYAFHQAMHLLIFVALVLFTRRIGKINHLQLVALFAIAVFLHNVGYWLTNVFPSIQALFADAALDFALTFFLFYAIRLSMKSRYLATLVNVGKGRL